MKVRNSKFKVLDSILIESKIETEQFDDLTYEQVKERLNKSSYNIDFEISENKSENQFGIELKVDNSGIKKVGYRYSVKVFFSFEVENLDKENEDLKIQYIFYTALPFALNNIRHHLSMVTSDGLYGKYRLPAIELSYIIDKWFKKNTEEYQF